MRLFQVLLLPCLVAAPVLAQNAPPPAPTAQTHVSKAESNVAAGDAKKAAATQSASGRDQAGAPQGKSVVLDSVIAVINGDVLLESDVEAERRFESLQLLPKDQNTAAHAAERLITRTLILQQMKEQDQSISDIKEQDVEKFIAELKKQQPGCLPTRCQSEAGWASYLAGLGMTPEEVRQRWKQQLIILNYLNLRFSSGIRIPADQVQAYYQKNLVPQFEAKHEKPPAVKTLRPRIKEILLQQQVSKQIDEWEATLRQEGSVEILVPAYGQSNKNAEDQDDIPGGAL
jgi:peptidyl-prolyl cis-trans isomerase SurA